MPLGVPDEIPEYGPSLLNAHLTHTHRIHEVKDVEVFC